MICLLSQIYSVPTSSLKFQAQGKTVSSQGCRAYGRLGGLCSGTRLYQAHIANYVDQPEVSAPCCSEDTFKLNTRADKYMRVPARRACTSWYSVITWLCRLGYGFSDLFKALHDTQKWSW